MRGPGGPRTILAVVLLSLVASPVFAQAADGLPAPRPHRITLSGGVVWTGSYGLGDTTVNLRGNGLGPSATPFPLFRAESSLDAVAGVEARVGFALTRDLTVETGFAYQQPGITTALSADAEAAAVTLEAEQLAQYVVDVAGVWQLPRVHVGALRPFLTVGGGYLRQLYEERTLVETGSLYYGGGGARYWFRGGDGLRRGIGLRADVRVQWRRDGVEFEGRTRVAPVVGVHAFVEF